MSIYGYVNPRFPRNTILESFRIKNLAYSTGVTGNIVAPEILSRRQNFLGNSVAPLNTRQNILGYFVAAQEILSLFSKEPCVALENSLQL